MTQQLGHNKFVEQALKYGFSLWGLPKTGQTIKYRDWDDGDFEKGYPAAPPRFKDNGDGTITDNATGLMWVKDPSQCGIHFGTPGSPDLMLWNYAIDICGLLNYAGHDDWRLPNVFELLSIYNRGKSTPAIDTDFFVCVATGIYWTSTKYKPQVNYRWRVNSTNGGDSIGIYTGTAYARPVRLGVPK